MTRRIIGFLDDVKGFQVSQEFNGDRNEFKQFMQRDVDIPTWDEVCYLFADGVKTQGYSLKTTRSLIRKIEDLYKYEHVPTHLRKSIPNEQEFWIVTDTGLQLYAKYGEIDYSQLLVFKLYVRPVSVLPFAHEGTYKTHIGIIDSAKGYKDRNKTCETKIIVETIK